MNQSRIYLMIFVFAIGLSYQQGAEAQIVVSNSVLGNGGAMISDSSYNIVGTLGQPVIGVVQKASQANRIGFWYLSSQMFITDVEQNTNSVPKAYRLEQNYSNPFNSTTAIQFALPKHSVVMLKLYDILGREVATLVDQDLEPGVHKVVFDANGLASGVYFYRIQAEDFVRTRKLMLLK